MDRDADVVVKNVDAMLAGPVVRTVTKNTIFIHPDGVVVDDTAIPHPTIHLKRTVWSFRIFIDTMGGADTNGAVVPVVVPDGQSPVNVKLIARCMPGTIGGHDCSHC